jgi:hypothetical protein
MCSGAYRKQGTCAAAYQPRISTVDGQATFFERDRQNTQIRELFRRCSLRRDYNYRPTLPDHRRRQLEEPALATGDQKTALSIDECDIKERQKLYDQKRQPRDRALREHQIQAARRRKMSAKTLARWEGLVERGKSLLSR